MTRVGILLVLVVVIAFLPVNAMGSGGGGRYTGGFNMPGNLLISDQFNNRVIEVNRQTGRIVWSFGSGNSMLCNPGPGAVIGPNDAERLSDGLTLIAGTGISQGIPNTTACADNRVIVVDQGGQIIWQYGRAGQSGNDTGLLNVPVFAIQLPNHDILIVDQGNNRVIEVNKQGQIVWSYGPHSGSGALNSPNSAELLSDGNILIADESNNRTIEVTRDGQIVWECCEGLGAVGFASRLANGNTLITDVGNGRVIEVTPDRNIVFQYYANGRSGSNPSLLPTNAVLLQSGQISMSDSGNNRALIINLDGTTAYQYGTTGFPGVGPNQLYEPYTAYVIGDYYGQTPPPPIF